MTKMYPLLKKKKKRPFLVVNLNWVFSFLNLMHGCEVDQGRDLPLETQFLLVETKDGSYLDKDEENSIIYGLPPSSRRPFPCLPPRQFQG